MDNKKTKLLQGIYRVEDENVIKPGSYTFTRDSDEYTSVSWSTQDGMGQYKDEHSFSLSKDGAQCHLDLQYRDIVTISGSVQMEPETGD